MGIFNRIKEVVRSIRFSGSPKLYGRFSAGAGEGEEINVGTGLRIVGGELQAFGLAGSTVESESFTADFGGRYVCVDSLTITDPASPTTGDEYAFIVADGEVTLDSETHPTGDLVHRIYIANAWKSFTYIPKPKGPHQNDGQAASAGIPIGHLYYDNAGHVLIRKQ